MTIYSKEYVLKLREKSNIYQKRNELINRQLDETTKLSIEEFKRQIESIQEELKEIEQRFGSDESLMISTNSISRKADLAVKEIENEVEQKIQELIKHLIES
jgi:hypothetical protein